MVGCKLVTPVGRARPRLQALLPHPARRARALHRDRPRRERPARLSQYRATDLGHDEPGEVDAVNGAFMLCRSDAVAEIGASTRATGSTWRTSTGATASGSAGGGSSTSPGVAVHVKGGTSAGRRAPRQEIAFHRGMGRFYRKFDAPGRNPLLDAASTRDRRQLAVAWPQSHLGTAPLTRGAAPTTMSWQRADPRGRSPRGPGGPAPRSSRPAADQHRVEVLAPARRPRSRASAG